MKTTINLAWTCLAVLALTFASTAFAGDNNTKLVVIDGAIRPNPVVVVVVTILRALGL
jgi:hypothetical protein